MVFGAGGVLAALLLAAALLARQLVGQRAAPRLQRRRRRPAHAHVTIRGSTRAHVSTYLWTGRGPVERVIRACLSFVQSLKVEGEIKVKQ